MFMISNCWKHFFPDNRWLLAKGGLWLAAVFALSALFFRFFEKPMMDLRDLPFFGSRKYARERGTDISPAGCPSPDAG